MPDWRALVRARVAEAGLDPATEAEVTEELAQHVTDRYRELRDGGQSEVDAIAGALRELDEHEHLTHDLVRLKEMPRRLPAMDFSGRHSRWSGVNEDMRYAVRRLVKRPGASLTSMGTLACGIGAAAATWSLLSAVLLHPLAVTDPDRLVVVGWQDTTSHRASAVPQIYPLFPYLRDSGVFDEVAASGSPVGTLLVGAAGIPQQSVVYFVSHNYFSMLGVGLPLGRGFSADDDRRGAPPVAVLSDRFWRRALEADPHVLGRDITVAGDPVTVVGVAPRSFRGLHLADVPELYLPLHVVGDVGPTTTNYFAEPNTRTSPTAWVSTIGRLRPNSDAAQATARLNALPPLPGARGSTQSFGLTNVNTAAIPEAARAGMAEFARLLAMTVGLLLLIGCLTVGMLLLIRTEARRDEFAMCLALGASRGRLARGVAMEGGLLSIAGAALALPIAWWWFAGIGAFQLPGAVDINLLDLSIDTRVLLAAAAGSLAATLVIALVAGVFGFSANVADVLRARSGGTPRVARRRTRALLVAAQVAVALVLLAGAGMFARSLVAALGLNPGFDTSRIVTGSVSLGEYGYTPIRAAEFFDTLRERLITHPAIRTVAFATFTGGMSPHGKLEIDGVPRQFPSMVMFNAIDAHYFSAMGIRLREGRDLADTDMEHSPLVTVVSASFGRMLSAGGNAVGHRITMPFSHDGVSPVVEVVGVVPDVVTNVNVLEPLVMYLPLAQQTATTYHDIVVRASADADAARRETMSEIKQLDGAVTTRPLQTIDERIGRQMSPQRFGALVLGGLGVIAALLTLLGTYVLAESMAILRRREMGIRAALGATERQLGAIVLAETARLVGVGLAVGLVLAWLGAGTIRAFLFHVQPLDPTTLASVAAAILTLALVVSLRPAWRAARVDLGSVLREE